MAQLNTHTCAQVEPLGAEEAAAAATPRAAVLWRRGRGRAQAEDQYYRLAVQQCFYVGGMGASCQAEVISAAEYQVRQMSWVPAPGQADRLGAWSGTCMERN